MRNNQRVRIGLPLSGTIQQCWHGLGLNPARRHSPYPRSRAPRIEPLEPRHVLSSTLLITEFMAENDTTLTDGNGNYSDWIEVHNPTTATIHLDGWYLTDDLDDLDQWPFPNISLAANAYLVLFASAPEDELGGLIDDYIDPDGNLHTNFKLDADGEYLALTVADGLGSPTIVHEYGAQYPEQIADASYGVSQTISTISLVPADTTTATALVPSDSSLDAPTPGEAPPWTLASFDDSTWTTSLSGGGTGIGFDAGDDSIPLNPEGVILSGGPVGHDLTDPEDDGTLDGTITVGNPNSPVNEEPHRALDNTTSTKWLSFAPAGTFYQFQFNTGPQLVNAYTITSANDVPARDPYSWTLSGSDDGIHFTPLDSRSEQDFANRFETQRFVFSNSTSYTYYRFDFLTEYGVHGTNEPVAIQLAEIELFSDGQVDYGNLIDIDIESDWTALRTSVYERIEFSITDPSAFNTLLLDMQYDDGFVAYLNGARVAESSAPTAVGFNSRANSQRSNGDAVLPEPFDITAHLDKLVSGTNVLAIQGLNVDSTSADLLIRPALTATEIIDSEYVPGYYNNPSPGTVNNERLTGFVADTQFSTDRGFYDTAFLLTIAATTSGADIYYTTNGDRPTLDSGTLYTEPIMIDKTTSLRAVAFKDDYIPSNVDTHTYIFVKDVVRQDQQATLAAGFPNSWGGLVPDYGMDPDVIGYFDTEGNPTGGDLFGGNYATTIQDDLQAIPTLSIVMNIDDMFGANGIYTNSTASGVAWERATSVELIYADGTEGFQVDAGIRIQGGAFRRDDLSKKHSLRLLFKDIYGPSKLAFPFFGEGAVDEYDTITLRMDSNDGWAWDAAGSQPQYARDEFARRTQLDLGQPAAHGNRAHVYINGIYWGLYNPVERPDASFAASYYGGNKSEWDVLNAGTPVDGNDDSWNMLRYLAQAVANASSETARTAAYMFLQGKNPDGTNNPSVENYLDVDNYIDFLIVNFYGGNVDWPHRNWFANRQRGLESTGFKFHIWDAEATLNLFGSNIYTNRTGQSDGVAEPYSDLRSSAEFRIRFADRLQRALFNDGPLTSANSVARYQQILDEIDQAIVAESARWGDMHRSTPYTKAHWENESNSVFTTFLTGRTNIFLSQLRSAGLYPSIHAATFNQRGGYVASGFDAVLTNPNGSGTIYYTTDGSDPRAIGGSVSGNAIAYTSPIDIVSATTIKVRILSGGEWSAIDEVAFTVAPPANVTNLRITEINYNPHDANPVPGLGELAVDNNEFEFVELRNISSQSIDLSNVQFVEVPVGDTNEGITFTFGQQALAPDEYVLVVKNLSAFESRFGSGLNIGGEYAGKLANGGEQLTLLAMDGSIIQQFEYNDTWSSRTDGQGSSLVVIDIHGDYGTSSNWRASTDFGGMPGASDSETVNVIVNEVLAHTDLPEVDSIELYNTTGAPVDLSGWWLSDTPNNYYKYQFVTGSVIGPGAYRVVDETDFNPGGGTYPTDFALDSGGDSVWLLEADAQGKPIRFADVVSFEATLNGVTLGRIPNGINVHELFPLAQNTLGIPNGPQRVGPILISEVHYHPGAPLPGSIITEQQLEFIELVNVSGQSIVLNESLLGGWQLRGGVDFDFQMLPIGTVLGPNELFVVVAFDPGNTGLVNAFRSIYGIGADISLIGPFNGQLDNSGEEVRLLAPTDPPQGGIDPVHYLVDRVTYDDMPPWASTPDGAGDSLNRINTNAFGDLASAWYAAAPTPGYTAFTTASPGDFDTDGDVDRTDLWIWVGGFGTTTGASLAMGDSDTDGDVDGSDFLTWQRNFGTTAASGSAADCPAELRNHAVNRVPAGKIAVAASFADRAWSDRFRKESKITSPCPLSPTGRGQGEGEENPEVIFESFLSTSRLPNTRLDISTIPIDDGAQTTPHTVRSSLKPYPYELAIDSLMAHWNRW